MAVHKVFKSARRVFSGRALSSRTTIGNAPDDPGALSEAEQDDAWQVGLELSGDLPVTPDTGWTPIPDGSQINFV